MNDRIIKIKSGVDYSIPQFQEYYQKLKEQKVDTYYLDYALKTNSIVLTDPLIFNDEDYTQYSIDDISFTWENDTIIGHQVINFSKEKATIFLGHNSGNHLDHSYINNLGHRRRFSCLEYYCVDNIDRHILIKYMDSRISGQLESEIHIAYEKTFEIKK